MNFRQIEIGETTEGSPYLLMTRTRLFHSIRCKTGFRKKYKFCNGTMKHAWGKNFDIYKLIPFHEELMLNRLLRQITGDPSFYCDVLDCDYITMRF